MATIANISILKNPTGVDIYPITLKQCIYGSDGNQAAVCTYTDTGKTTTLPAHV